MNPLAVSRRLAAAVLALVVCACACACAPAQELVEDPGFDRATETTKAVGWSFPDFMTPSGSKLVVEGPNRFLSFTNTDATKVVGMERTVDLPPGTTVVVVSAKVRVRGLKLGTEGWHEPRAAMRFQNAKGEGVGGYLALSQREDTDWKTVRQEYDVPTGGVRLNIQPGLWLCTGTFDVDDLSVQSYAARSDLPAAPLADAPLPAARAADAEQKPATQLTDRRAEIDLDGVWKFAPAAGATLKEPRGFGWITVPGAWNDAGAIVARGGGELWQRFNGNEVAQAWYERTVTIPADWADRAVLLDVDRVSTDAVVYLDGTEMGQVRWPAGRVDLTPGVTPGTAQQLRLRVLAVDDKTEVTHYMGYVNEPKAKAELQYRGIIGKGLKLLARPKQAYVYDLAIRPSTRQKTLDVEVELGAVPATGQLEVSAEALDEQGNVEKSFPAQRIDLATTKPSPTVLAQDIKAIEVVWPWSDPRLWDYRQPNRYTLRLSVKPSGAAVASDIVAQGFGFREWWIDGRQFFLNNTPYNLRPQTLDYGAMPAKYLAEHYNWGELWPNDRGRRGSDTYDDQVIAEADRIGFPIAGKAMHMADYAGNIAGFESDPNLKAEWRRLMELDLRRWRNDPAIVMWAHSANAFQNNGDGDPRELGRTGITCQQEQVLRHRNVWELIGLIKQLDPTRPVYAHHGSDHGEVYTSNFYLNFTPLQEREEWMAYWAKHGELPFIAIEFGPPLYASMQRDKDGYTHQGMSEPNLTEWMAVYLGPEAYRLEPKDLRRIFLERYKGPKADFKDEYQPHLRDGQFDRILWSSDSFVKMQNLFYRNTWRSWRTMGVTGMGIAWHQTDPKLFTELARNNDDTLAWIAGPAGATGGDTPTDPSLPNFTRKDHHFRPGEAAQKQVVLINDARAPQPYAATWEVTVGGTRVAGGEKSGTIAVGAKLFFPVDFTVPRAAADRTAGVVTLSAKIGVAEHRDEFAFTVLTPPAKAHGTVAAYDPVGVTTKYLESLGYNVRPWAAGAAPIGDVVVIGRGALSSGHAPPAGLGAYLAGGGRVVVFGQDRDWIKLTLQLRTAEQVSRRAYRVSAEHPVTRGLDDADLADWSGEGTLIAGHPYYPGLEWPNYYGWHWGNRGSVSSAMIELPHRSGLRPILVGEFDLAYSPLAELEYGKGRLVLCTLDLEDRRTLDGANDPAADRLATQLMEYVRTAPIAAKPDPTHVVYLGDAAGSKVLDDLGVLYAKADAIAADTALAIVGGGVDLAAVRPLLERGGKALFLARGAGKGPAGVTIAQVQDCQGSITPPAWPEAAGLTASDLHWKTVYDGRVITAVAGGEVAADGQLGRLRLGAGVAIFAQVDPTWLPADRLHYFRFTRWRQTRALAQLLANLGATFQQDRALVALLEQPPHGHALAGAWEVQLTTPKPESHLRQWNPQGEMSALAKRLVALGPGEGDGWQTVSVPAYMESYSPPQKWRWTDGECVFRTVVDVPDYLAGRDMYLCVGRVDEWEKTFVNGEFVGESHAWLVPRGHTIPGRLIKAGKNVIALRTWDEGIHGGLGGPRETYFLRVAGPSVGFYHPDYLDDLPSATNEKDAELQFQRWNIADNPYRYTRW